MGKFSHLQTDVTLCYLLFPKLAAISTFVSPQQNYAAQIVAIQREVRGRNLESILTFLITVEQCCNYTHADANCVIE